MFQEYIPILTTIISAVVVLIGYFYEKQKERQFEIDKTRKELYFNLIKNLSEKLDLFEKVRGDPDMPEKVTTENAAGVMTMVAKKYPELDANFNKGREIMHLMALYGDDKAVKACANFYRASWAGMQPGSKVRPDIDILLTQLRLTIYRRSKVSYDDIRFITSK